jgi:hypothetical protein
MPAHNVHRPDNHRHFGIESLSLAVKKIEEQIELFLLLMGSLAVTISSRGELPLLFEDLKEPIMITAAVLAAGFHFRFSYGRTGSFADGL